MRKFSTFSLALALGIGLAIASGPGQRSLSGAVRETPSQAPLPRVSLSQSLPAALQSQKSGVHLFNESSRGMLAGPSRQNAPQRVNAAGGTVYGWVSYDADNIVGLCIGEVFPDATVTLVQPAPKGDLNRPLGQRVFTSYVRENKFYTLAQGSTYDGYILIVQDLLTGQTERTPNIPETSLVNWQFTGYDSDNDLLYGYVIEDKVVKFGHAPGDNPLDFTATGEFDWTTLPSSGWQVIASTFNPSTKQFLMIWGEKENNAIYEADLTTGNLTYLGDLPEPCQYTTGMAYSPYDGAYYFATCNDTGCAILLLDPKDFSVKSRADYPGLIEFQALHCADSRIIADGAPGRATFVRADFPRGASDGEMVYRMATATRQGTPIMGNVGWVLYVDGKEAARGSAAAGAEIAIPVKGLTAGYHKFSLRLSLGTKAGEDCRNEIYIGNDTPAAPQTVTLTSQTVTWTPVTEGIHGAYVDPEAVTYNVYLNDELIASGAKGTSVPTGLDENTQLQPFTAAVEAVFDGKVSEKTYSDDIQYGSPVTLPYSVLPTEKESHLFTRVNSGDYDFFYFYNGPHAAYGETISEIACMTYNAEHSPTNFYDRNSYLFLPPARFDDPDKVYNFSAEIFATNKNYEEKYEVVLCKTTDPASRVKTLIAEKKAYNLEVPGPHEPLMQTADFTVPEAGVYYVAIHPTSTRGERLHMCKFSLDISDGVTSKSPNMATDITVTAGINGALEATLSFRMPTVNAAEEPYEASKELSMTVRADGNEAVTVSGTPGEAKTVTVPTSQGDNCITLTPADGDLKGISADVTVYTGVYVPGIPSSLRATPGANPLTVRLSWNPPLNSLPAGNYVSPEGVTYYLCQQQGNNWVITGRIGVDIHSIELSVPEGTPQTLASFGVLAENAAGQSTQLATTQCIIGTSCEVPMENSYTAGDNTQPVVFYNCNMTMPFGPGNPGQFFPQYATEDNLSALFTFAFMAEPNTFMTLPRFSTVGVDRPAIELYIYGGSCPEFRVTASAYETEPANYLAVFRDTDFATPGPQRVRIELPAEFKDKEWVLPQITFNAPSGRSFILYGYRYVDNLADDLCVSRLAGNSFAAIGEEARFSATVLNMGYEAQAFPGARWELRNSSGDLVAAAEAAPQASPLPADESIVSELAYTPTAEDLGPMQLTYTINGTDDKTANNSRTLEVNVVKGNVPVVTDLHATEIDHSHVKLDWTAPAGAPLTESLEEEEPFIIDEDGNRVGPFTRLDRDGETVYCPSSPAFKELPFAGRPASFTVYSEADLIPVLGPSMYTARTGDKFLAAFCPGTGNSPEPAADDWLISPRVAPGSSMSFFVKPITFDYGAETLEILYSSSDTNPRHFTLLTTISLDGKKGETPVYEQYGLTLPDDARYFAIHYVSRDIFGIFIDDITFVPEDAQSPVSFFEVYCDGEQVGKTDGALPGFDDTAVAENTSYRYMVLPALSDGTHGAGSNILLIRTTSADGIASGARSISARDGIITIAGYAGEPVSVVTADGRLAASAATAAERETIAVASGVYVVKAGSDVVKLIVK